jgi:hypothetical protein
MSIKMSGNDGRFPPLKNPSKGIPEMLILLSRAKVHGSKLVTVAWGVVERIAGPLETAENGYGATSLALN